MTSEKYSLPTVDFGSDLVRYAFEVERLRGDLGRGTTSNELLTELNGLFRLVMSVISARIEGNHTTVYDAIDGLGARPTPYVAERDSIREIVNILGAIDYIDTVDVARPITHSFIRELHRLTVDDLQREGDRTPGQYRSSEVAISSSAHVPPSHVYVHAEMTELLEFANREVPMHEQMLHVAIAHHRFVWIHPFANGNGRVSRLLTYAMLRRNGFDSGSGYRTVNPTAVFGSERDGYYTALQRADDLSADGTAAWCEFFVRGLRDDLDRLIRLQDSSFVTDQLLEPAFNMLRLRGVVNPEELAALRVARERGIVKAGDLSGALAGTASQRSIKIKSLVERGLLTKDERGPRFYRLVLSRGPLASVVIRRLDEIGYLPSLLKDDYPVLP